MPSPKLPHTENTEVRIALLEQSITHISETLTRIESRFGKSDSEASANFKWLIGIFVTIGLSLAAWIHVH